MSDTPAIHAEVNDFFRKDGFLVRVMEIDVPEGCYYTSDGGLIGFHEVGADNVFLESEVYEELDGRPLDAVETNDEQDRKTPSSTHAAPEAGY